MEVDTIFAMGRIATTIELARSSWEVLKADKELLALPVMSTVATIITAITFLAPLLATGGLAEAPDAVGYVVFVALYLALAFVTIFFNAALVHAADQRLSGGDPTLGSALRGAWERVGRILPWAAVSATVSVILRSIEERAGIVGQIAAGLAGVAWSVVTFLVLPVLVLENIGVVDAVKRSGALFRQTWGENVAARVGFGILGFLAGLPAVALVLLGAAAGGTTIAVAIVVAVLWMAAVSVVLASLNGIFQTALYHYAVNGEAVGGAFSAANFSAAFVPKRGRGFGSGL